MSIRLTILLILITMIVEFIVFVMLYARHEDKVIKDQKIYFTAVRLYERFIQQCPNCRSKIEKEFQKLKIKRVTNENGRRK